MELSGLERPLPSVERVLRGRSWNLPLAQDERTLDDRESVPSLVEIDIDDEDDGTAIGSRTHAQRSNAANGATRGCGSGGRITMTCFLDLVSAT
jgi:hypothetical protein